MKLVQPWIPNSTVQKIIETIGLPIPTHFNPNTFHSHSYIFHSQFFHNPVLISVTLIILLTKNFHSSLK